MTATDSPTPTTGAPTTGTPDAGTPDTGAPDARTPDAVLGALTTDLAGSLGIALIAIGNRCGLWRALDGAGPLSAGQLAERTGIDASLAREWARAQAAGGYLDYRPGADGTDTFTLPDAVAAAMLAGPGAAMVDVCVEMFTALCTELDEIGAAFAAGGGFGWHRHDAHFWHGSDGFTRIALPDELIGAVLDQLGPTTEALRSGAGILDVGSGYGTPTIALARHFPAARVLGVDYNEGSVAAARQAAAQAAVADRVRFQVGAATDLPGSGYALVTFFDSLHDLGDPVGALVQAREVLAPGGAVLLVEPLGADRVEDNFTPSGRMFYAVSTLICTANAVAQGATAPLGALAGEARLREVAAEAGFTTVRRVPVEAPMNLVLELRP